jgi:hypothetical protein
VLRQYRLERHRDIGDVLRAPLAKEVKRQVQVARRRVPCSREPPRQRSHVLYDPLLENRG